MIHSIFDGLDKIVHDALGVQAGEKLQNKTTCRRLCNEMPATRFLPELIPTLFERVAKNLAENWSGRLFWFSYPFFQELVSAKRNRYCLS